MGKRTAVLELFTFLLGLVSYASCEQTCPGSGIADTCECIDAYNKIFLKCQNATDEALKESLTALKGYVLTELHIEDSTIRHIPTKLLKEITLYRIHVVDSQLFYLFDLPLSGSVASSLSSLKLSSVEFELGLDWSLFEDVNSLETIVLSNTPIYRIEQPLSELSQSIETLELSDSEIEFIHAKAFSELKNLHNLLLKNNRLNAFSRLMMPYPTSEIQLLDISNNLLTSLPKNAFDGMPKLNSLMLHGNQFRILEEVYMGKIWNQLFFFNVQDNPLECCEVSWMAGKGKPMHLFGHCVEKGTASVRELKQIEDSDLAQC